MWFVLGLITGWLSMRLMRRRPFLAPAIEATRSTFTSQSAGLVSYYVDTQVAGQRPLLLIHSINAGPSAYEVKPLFEYYRTRRAVYALDLPGFGFSERADRRYSPELYADVLTEFIEQQIGEAVDVIALSLSSEFAARAALQTPALYNSLAFISPTGFNASDPSIPEETLYNVFSFPLWSQSFFDLLVVRRSIKYFTGRNFIAEPPKGFIDYAYATAHQVGARYAPLYFVSGQLFTNGVRDSIYAKLEVPTLVIYDEDPNISFDKLPEFVAAHPHWQAERLAPSLGLPHWEMLEKTVDALEEFWKS